MASQENPKGRLIKTTLEGEEIYQQEQPPDWKLAQDKAAADKDAQNMIDRLKQSSPGVFNDAKAPATAMPEERIVASERPADMDEQSRRKIDEDFRIARGLQEKIGDPRH